MATLRMHACGCAALTLLFAPVSLAGQQTIRLPARDRILAEKPEVLYAVGAEQGEDWQLLSGVRGVAFDASDNLYVLDSNNFRVLIFDVTGKFLRRISRQGEGPGELMSPTGMTVMADGTVVVSDGGRRAYSLFNSDGTFVRDVSYGVGEGVGSRMEGLRSHPSRGVVTQIQPLRARGSEGSAAGERKVRLTWLDLSATDSPATVLYAFTMPPIAPRVDELPGRGVSITTVPPNWTPALTFGVLPNGGLSVADDADYRVKVVSPAGKVERIIERPIAPRRGTPKDKEAFIKREAENLMQGVPQSRRTDRGSGAASGAGPTLAMIEELVRNATWLDVIPVLRRVSADPQGRIWVARTPDDFAVSGAVDILRADGAYIGTIPDATVPGAVSKTGRAAFITRDELGVERVTVKRLPANWQ